jgi:hypothetical protein
MAQLQQGFATSETGFMAVSHVRFVPILLQKSAMTGAWPVARRS